MNVAHSVERGAWAVRLPIGQSSAVAALRRWPELFVLEESGGTIWLRGDSCGDTLDLALRKLPGAERFTVGSDGTITPLGKRVPAGELPGGNWLAIAAWCQLAIQPAALAGQAKQRTALRLVRADREEPASVLVTTLAPWTAWAADAPQVRLRPLAFAASEDGRVVVRGSPLPPIAGKRYVERGGVAVPSGMALLPAIDAATVRALLKIKPTDLALLAADDTWERIDESDFVAATRAAARATQDAADGVLTSDL